MRHLSAVVNFVLHAHLAAADLGDPRAAFGAMLPDLWRMAARAARSKRGVEEPGRDPSVGAVLAGVEHHLAIDRWFHATPFFVEGDRATKAALASVPADLSPRLRLFAHATWEMLLDGALIRRVGEATVAKRLAESVGAARRLAAPAGDLHHGEARGAAGVDPAVFAARMTRLLDAVESFALPAGYATAEGVASRLTGIRAAFGFAPPSPEERALWIDALSSLERLAEESVDGLVAARR